jgi:hypothetical protein
MLFLLSPILGSGTTLLGQIIWRSALVLVCVYIEVVILVWAIGPDPQERPNRVQSEQDDPTADVDRIMMRMIARLGDVAGNVVEEDDAVEVEPLHRSVDHPR